MATYRLLAGQHIVVDRSSPIRGEDGKPTGRFKEAVYTARPGAGVTVESDQDLVAKFGPGKFELVSSGRADRERIAELEAQLAEARAASGAPNDPGAQQTLGSPAHFPGGQVSTGFQANGGPLDPELAERAFAEGEGPRGQGEQAAARKGRAARADAEEEGEAQGDEIDSLSVEELKQYCDDNEIDRTGLTKKAELQRAARGARKGR